MLGLGVGHMARSRDAGMEHRTMIDINSGTFDQLKISNWNWRHIRQEDPKRIMEGRILSTYE